MRRIRGGAGGMRGGGREDMRQAVENAKFAEDCGLDSLFVAELWGRDAFTTLSILAYETSTIKLGTSIVNTYSRSPAALAQHFGSLDELTGGRMIIGLGTTSANVSDHFHGVPFGRPLTRMREYIEIINTLIAGEPLVHDGYHFKGMNRGFTLRGLNLPRKHIPIYIASQGPNSVRATAEIADGWLPIHQPRERWASELKPFFDAARAAGRDPDELTVATAAGVTVTDNPEPVYQGVAGGLAYYIARMGDFYYNHFVAMGYGEMADRVRAGWAEGGGEAAARAIPQELREQMVCAGPVEKCVEWMEAAEEAGYRLHSANVAEPDRAKRAEIYRKLVG